jgi:hypothetical protein
MKVREAFEKDNPCPQEGFVDALLWIIDRAGGGGIHAQERDATLCENLGSLQC